MRKKSIPITLGIVSVASIVALTNLPVLRGAGLIEVSNTQSRIGEGQLSDHQYLFTTPSGVASTEDMVITLPAGFDGTLDPQGTLDSTDVALLVNPTPNGLCDGTAQTLVTSGAAATEWNAVFSGAGSTVLTLTSGGASATVPAGAEVCVQIGENTPTGTAASQYQNPATAGEYTITITTGSGTDTGNLVIAIITDDQVLITANIAQTLFFDLSANNVGFGTLSELATRYATGSLTGSATETEAHTLDAGTNASNGYTITVSGPTLTNAAAGGATINAIGAANTAPTIGTEQFGIRLEASGGIGSVLTPYDGAGFAFDDISQPSPIATASAPSATTTYSTRYIANIDSLTPAGSYETTLTYIATGNF